MTRRNLLGLLLLTMVLFLSATIGTATGPIIPAYAGDISATFGPVTDTCAFEFSLWDATAGGSRIGPVIERELPVKDGIYQTELDFGGDAAGDRSRFLEVAVGCPAGAADLTALTRYLYLPDSGAVRRDRSGSRATSPGSAAPSKAALGTGFTYQGELQQSGSPVSGAGDFEFSLWDAASGGGQIGATVPAASVAVENGRFTVSLDFGAAVFDGDARWLEIAVRYPAGSGGYTTLAPRQPLTAAPYALQTRGIFVDDAGQVGIGTVAPADLLHVVGSTTIGGALRVDSGQGIQFPDFGNRIYQDLGDLRLESTDDITVNPADDLQVDGSTLVVDSPTNRVGVGISAPVERLHVNGTTLVDGDVRLTPEHGITFDTTANRIYHDVDDLRIEAADDVFIDPGDDLFVDSFTFVVDGSTNRVGIGVSTPASPLHVAGDVRTTGDFIVYPARTRYLQIPVSAFQRVEPDSSDGLSIEENYGYFNSGAPPFLASVVAPVQLPHGATVKELRVYYYDSSSTANVAATAELFRWSTSAIGGASMGTATGSTTGSSSVPQSAAQGTISYADIDNASYRYVVRVDFESGGAGTLLRIYGCRITYLISTLQP